MSILSYFQNITLTQDQKSAVESIEDFLQSGDNIFILRGYAGTGKTTILKGVVEYIKSSGTQSILMAPTGRAAKILREKVGEAQTIHKGIYNLSKIETSTKDSDVASNKVHYHFPLDNSPISSVLIIDEASMISSMKSNHELFSFGSGILLDDLITFSKLPNTGNKIIFVGDPAQLPPVGDNNSYALQPEYFKSKGFGVESAYLKTVLRQQNNAILENATKIRKLLDKEKRTRLEFHYDDHSFRRIENTEIANKFVEENPVPEIGGGVIISFSNEQCLNYNLSIRNKLYPGKKYVIPSDLLLIINNNYHSYGTELMNGDMVKVLEVENEIISRTNIPVYDTVNGEQVKKHINLDFRKIIIRPEGRTEELSCYIIDSLLNSPNRDLSILEMKALYIDFVMRFHNDQELKKKLGQSYYRQGTDEFLKMLKQDQFYNALRVKYAYAITCHKSQGGEWDTVFVDYFGRNSLKTDPLRWSYTATTRARKICYAANAPHLSDFSHFKISSISNLSRIPDDYFDLSQIVLSPFHREEDHRSKSLKYWEIASKLENTPFEIRDVFTRPYLERYTVVRQEKVIKVEAHHNGAGIFSGFNILDPTSEDYEMLLHEFLNAPYQHNFNIEYSPGSESLSKLYSLIQAACGACDVSLTNVVEKKESYLVTYYLKTNAKAAMIQFYWNKNEQITRAMPKSIDGVNDEKLNEIIAEIVKLTYQPSEV